MPDFSDSNRVALRIKREATWGVLASAQTFKAMNFTSESLKGNINTVTSDTIRSDRNVSDITVVGGGAGGDTAFEVRFGEEFNEELSGALNADWVTTTCSAAVASARVSAAVLKADSSSLSHLRAGMFVRNTGATASSTNDGDFQVASAVHTAGDSVVTLLTAATGVSAAFTGEAYAGDTQTTGKHLRNGITKISYSIEKEFQDVSAWREYAGMRIGSMSLNVASQAILTGGFTFVGKSEAIASATITSATTAADTGDVMNAAGNVNRIWEGTQAVSNAVFQNLTLELTNNTREQSQVGSDDLAGVGLGRCEITGTLDAYFEDDSLVTKFINNTDSNVRFQVQDNDNNAYIFSIPKVRYTDSTVAAGGPNADVVQNLTWGAIVDDAGVYAIGVDALED